LHESTEFGGQALEAGRLPRDGFYRRMGKRIFDVVMVLLMLPLLAPVILVLALLAGRGRLGFFGHERVGRGGALFNCWKIRSMVPDAEERLAAHLAADPAAAAEWEETFKLRNDPRITRFGNFLRRTSLDELPQIWNVLKGEMSFVGPRPVVAQELERYGASAPAYLALRPGVTGMWQVSGRNDISYAERVQMDAIYGRRLGLVLDMKLMVQTVGAVFARTGC
jgi:lipopolysaccharide/colanic/teichoic acid biosynthesis glycosyltransferase